MAKILIYSDCFIFGGSENVIENLLKCDSLSKKYNFSFYYAYSKRYKTKVDEKFAGFKNIYSTPILSSYNKFGYDAQLSKSAYLKMRYALSLIVEKAGIYNRFNFLKLYKIFKLELPDILYINNGGYPGAASARVAVLSAQAAGIKKIIFNVNNLALPQNGIADKNLDEKIAAAVNFFSTASKAAKKNLVHKRGFDERNCIVIPNTVLQQREKDAAVTKPYLREEFKLNNNELIFGAAGLLTERKGFLVLIEAANILKSKTSAPFKVFIFGEGEQRQEIKNKIQDYKLENFVVMPGHRNDVIKYIKGIDVFVCPSVANEDLPYVVLEAMLLKKPIVGTNIAGIPEQVTDNYNGFIVAAGDAGHLAEKMEIFIKQPEMINEMGQNSFKLYTEKFKNARVMQRYDELFQSL